jgi:endonuclease YncB( thermonuclease family)
MRQVTVWLFVFLASNACAETLVGRVVNVADGDTLTLLDTGNRQHKIRLAEIDAPEKDQAFGQRSRQSLAALCAGQAAEVVNEGRDRYGRVVGRVSCARVDANREQVRRGMAWVFDRYAPANSPLYRLQAEARTARQGLWYDPRPMAPWTWRSTRSSRPKPERLRPT